MVRATASISASTKSSVTRPPAAALAPSVLAAARAGAGPAACAPAASASSRPASRGCSENRAVERAMGGAVR